jgi:arylsulfatase A-like enzyme
VTRVTTQVRTIDIMHTILDLLGFAPAESPHGRSLIPLMAGEETENRFAWSTVAESPYFDFVTRYSLRTGTHKVILTPRKGGGYDTELFDLESDPGERANQIETDASRTARLRKTLLKLRAGLEGRGPARYRVQVKTGMEDIEARLRELGYIE